MARINNTIYMLTMFYKWIGKPWNQPHIRRFSEYVFRIFFIDFSTALFEQILFHLPIKVDYNRTDGSKQQKKKIIHHGICQKRVVYPAYNDQGWWNREGAGEALSDFGRSVDPISIRRADYSHKWETEIRYWLTLSAESIGIRAELFLPKPKLFFFKFYSFFSYFLGEYKFL